MPRFKPVHRGRKLLPVGFERQIRPGGSNTPSATRSITNSTSPPSTPRYENDDEGAPACDPAVLIEIVLPGCSRGIVSSRRIELAPCPTA